MLTACEWVNHDKPDFGLDGRFRLWIPGGYSQTLTLNSATVEHAGESVIADVSICLSVDECGRGSIAFRFTDAPRALRDSLREAAERYPAEPFVPFAVVDGARCDVPALPWQAIGSADEGPVSVTLYGENLRKLVPWPVKEK